MNNRQNMIKSLKKLKRAFSDVNIAWDQCNEMNDLTNSDYPFEKSFDELNIKVQDWVDDSINELEEKI